MAAALPLMNTQTLSLPRKVKTSSPPDLNQ